jgi:hypothetical protein
MSERFGCLYCRRYIHNHRSDARYCSAKCRQAAYRERLREAERQEARADPYADVPLGGVLDDRTRKRLEQDLKLELRNMRRRYAVLGRTYGAAMRAEGAAVAAAELKAPPWHAGL